MPYLKQATTDDIETLREVMEAAIDTMAEAGFRHKDIKLDHVGFYRQQGELRAALFDLADVTKIHVEDRGRAKEAMKRLLFEADVAATTPGGSSLGS